MADIKNEDAPSLPAAEPYALCVVLFTDDDGDTLVMVQIEGIQFFAMVNNAAQGMDIAQRTIAALMRFQQSVTVELTDLKPKEGSGN
jgi:hypothetical protein